MGGKNLRQISSDLPDYENELEIDTEDDSPSILDEV